MISSSHQLWLKSQLHNQRQHFQMYPHLSPNLPSPYESSQSKPLFKDCLYKVVMNNQKTKDKKNVQTGTPREGSLVSNTSLESCPLIISSRLLSLNISQHKLCWRLSPCWGSSTGKGTPTLATLDLCAVTLHTDWLHFPWSLKHQLRHQLKEFCLLHSSKETTFWNSHCWGTWSAVLSTSCCEII